MKRISACGIVTVLSVLMCYGGLFAGSRSKAKDDLKEARAFFEKVEKNNELRDYIPFQHIIAAKAFIDKAAYQVDEGGEYDEASFYARSAIIDLETALVTAKTRLVKQKKLEAEKSFYKNLVLTSPRYAKYYVEIAGAHLKKLGQAYVATHPDMVIFKGNTLVLNEKGTQILHNIAKVLKSWRRSRITIIGHTSANDPGSSNSNKKAEAISSYLTTIEGVNEKIITVKGMGKDRPIEVEGKMRNVDRIEIIITGID